MSVAFVFQTFLKAADVRVRRTALLTLSNRNLIHVQKEKEISSLLVYFLHKT